MKNSYMEMIVLIGDNEARKTGVGAALESNKATLENFRANKKAHSCEPENAKFICDYYNAKGDLSDSFFLTGESFMQIADEPIKTDEEYRKFDNKFWDRKPRITA